MKIEHVALQVGDPAAMAGWYVEHLGCSVARAGDAPAFIHFLRDSAGTSMLELYHNPRVAVPDYASMDPMLVHVAFVSADPAADRDRLVAAGLVVAEHAVLLRAEPLDRTPLERRAQLGAAERARPALVEDLQRAERFMAIEPEGIAALRQFVRRVRWWQAPADGMAPATAAEQSTRVAALLAPRPDPAGRFASRGSLVSPADERTLIGLSSSRNAQDPSFGHVQPTGGAT